MSYGTGRERKERLRKLDKITDKNVGDFLKLAGEQYASDFVNTVNDRASDRETAIDARFLRAIADKDAIGATAAFNSDVGNNNLLDIIRDIIRKQTDINYEADVAETVKKFFDTPTARGEFFKYAERGIRKVSQAPLQLGISRTVLQKYLNSKEV